MKFLADSLLLAALAASACPAQLPLFGDERPRLPGRSGSGSASALADVDGDGLFDVIRASGDVLDVLIQEPTGGFVRASAPVGLGLSGGASVVSVCVGVLTPGGSLPDVVVGVSGADSIVLRNNGAGAFGQQITTNLPRPSGFTGATTQVVVADFDAAIGDDVLVLHDGAQPQLFLLQSSGAFIDRSAAFLPAGFFPQSPIAAVDDFTGDGLPDVALVRRGIQATPILLASQGGGKMGVRAGAFVTSSYIASVVAAGDLTSDGSPDILLAPSGAGGGSMRALVNDGSGRFTSSSLVSFATGAVMDLVIGGINSDAQDDIAILNGDGSVDVSLGRGNQFAALNTALPAGSRRDLCLADIEGDGDGDLYVLGRFVEDSLLLGDAAGSFLATEEVSMPAGNLARGLLVTALDVTGEGDPDLAGYDGAGNPICLVNDGAARFTRAQNMLPTVASVVRDVSAAAVGAPDAEGLIVLGARTGSARVGVSVLMAQNGRLVDDTSARWPASVTGSMEAIGVGDLVAGGAGTTGFDDVVTVDDQGGMLLFTNVAGVFSPSFAFGFGAVLGAVQVLTGYLDGDAILDVVVLTRSGPPAVFLGQPGGVYQQVPQTNIGPTPARQGIIAELTGDGIADVLVVSRLQPATVYLLEGVGDGTFTDQSAAAPAPLPAGLTAVAAVGGSSRAQPEQLVFGSGTAADVVFSRVGTSFSRRLVMPGRGSHRTADVLVRDLDVDGDEDLVIVRSTALPRVLFDQSFQLSSLGIAQVGRPLTIRARGPNIGSAALMISAGTRRLPLLNWGLLRLNPGAGLFQLASFPIPASGSFDLTIPTLASYPPFELPMQMGYLDMVQGRLSLSNLEFQRAVAH